MKQTILKLLLFINSILLIAYMGLTAHADFHLNTRGVIPLFLSSLLFIMLAVFYFYSDIS
jgi:two-component system, NarL family, secretion system sensor histidine kinase SalK